VGSVQPWSLTARWILPVEGPPLERGIVTIRSTRILAVEPPGPRPADHDLGNVAILPGLVNAHTHLDLSALADTSLERQRRAFAGAPGLYEKLPFTDWLRTVIAQRRNLRPDQVRRNIRANLKQCLAAGTTLLADISSQGLSWDILAKTNRIRAVVFAELLGLPRTRAHQTWAAACEWVRNHPGGKSCRPGLSPHAPYSVRASVFGATARLSGMQQIPLAIHLAETREELELLEHHRGPFVPFLSELGVWDAQGLAKGIDEVFRLARPAANVLFIHGNYLDAPAGFSPGATLVYCPRTHAAFGHEPHPFRRLLAEGVRIALGTDSLASNPDLDVLAEARFLYRHYPDLPPATLLRMLTLSGAEALGWEKETGSLAPGKSADLVVLPLPLEMDSDPYEAIFASSLPIQATLFRGKWIQKT